jgi:putative addiction module CopG family antidote
MRKSLTMNVRVSGTLGDFVASRVSEDGAYENVSEYVRDLIRRDKELLEEQAFARLKSELQRGFSAPEDSYRKLDAQTVIDRGRQRSAG